jgi:hypothetical protein
MPQQIQLRRGAAASWTTSNPTLAAGELGVETDTNKFKVGDGSTSWTSLPYATKGDTGNTGPTGPAGTTGATGASGPTGPQGAAGEVSLTAAQTLTNKTLTSPVITQPKITDTPFAITDGASVDINPSNGFIQTWTLASSRTPVSPTSFASGQAVMLAITAGANTITWTSVGVSWTKQGGSGTAPTLSTSATSFIILHKIGSTIYGSYLGDA